MSYKFKGWIPTVTGRLSFSIIGASDENYNCNVTTNEKRYIVSSEKRYLSDSILPKIIVRKILKHESDYWFLCVGSSGDNPELSRDRLDGTIYVFGRRQWDIVHSFIKSKVQELNNCPSNEQKNILFQNLLDLSVDKLQLKSLFFCNFKLNRDGIVKISTPKEIQNLVSKDAPVTSDNSKSDHDSTHNRCSQMFFFLKDMTHIHQHHSSTMDTLIGLYPITDDEDSRWKSETLRVLQRKVLEYKRSISRDTNGVVNNIRNSSLGTLSYMKSFIEICKKDETEVIEPNWNIECLESSILAAQESQKNKIQASLRASDLTRNLFLALLSMIFSFVGLGALIGTFTKEQDIKKVEADEIYITIITFILQYPVLLFLAITFLIILIYIKVNFVNIKRTTPIRNLIRLLQIFKQTHHALIIIALACLNIFIVYKLLKVIITLST